MQNTPYGAVPLCGWGGVGGDMCGIVYLCTYSIKWWNNAPIDLSIDEGCQHKMGRLGHREPKKGRGTS